jgi:hypothetical protein
MTVNSFLSLFSNNDLCSGSTFDAEISLLNSCISSHPAFVDLECKTRRGVGISYFQHPDVQGIG